MKAKEIKNEFVGYIELLPYFIRRRILRYERAGKNEIFLLFREYLQCLVEYGQISIQQWDDIELDKRTYKRIEKILEIK